MGILPVWHDALMDMLNWHKISISLMALLYVIVERDSLMPWCKGFFKSAS